MISEDALTAQIEPEAGVREPASEEWRAHWRSVVTVSIGIAQMKQHREPMSFIKAADEKLYLAKDNGRNRVEGGLE